MSTLFPNIILLDRRPDIVEAWEDHFTGVPGITTVIGSFNDKIADIIVSPANSFGFMNGGIDFAYTQFFGPQIQEKVQSSIKTNFGGELLIGQALLVQTDHVQFPYMIAAPTMRLPMKITDPADVFLATRAALRIAVRMQNAVDGQLTILFPGMGTGAGMIPPDFCADHMRKAYDAVRYGETFPASWEEGLQRTYGPRK